MQNLPCQSCSLLLQEWLCMRYQEWRQENTTEIHTKCRPDDKFIGIETNDNYNETIKFK